MFVCTCMLVCCSYRARTCVHVSSNNGTPQQDGEVSIRLQSVHGTCFALQHSNIPLSLILLLCVCACGRVSFASLARRSPTRDRRRRAIIGRGKSSGRVPPKWHQGRDVVGPGSRTYLTTYLRHFVLHGKILERVQFTNVVGVRFVCRFVGITLHSCLTIEIKLNQ